MDKNILEYINNLGLSHLDWEPNEKECESDYCMAVISWDSRLSLEVVKHQYFEESDNFNAWMSADDLGWQGPVRFVMAWTPLSI